MTETGLPMDYNNMSPVLAMMAVQLGMPATAYKTVRQAQSRLHKTLKRTHKNRLK